jgi:toxin ParE1/3/4
MKKYKVVYSDGARKDILSIIDYIETNFDSPLDATKIAIKLFRKCESLATFPKGTPVYHIDGLAKKYRFAHIKKYTIIYYIDDGCAEVVIQAIINSNRDIESILNDG